MGLDESLFNHNFQDVFNCVLTDSQNTLKTTAQARHNCNYLFTERFDNFDPNPAIGRFVSIVTEEIVFVNVINYDTG